MQNNLLNSLKISREKAGLTQKEVECSLSMRALMMRDYEIGRLKLPVSVAIDLAKLYSISVDELVGNEQVMSNIYQSKVLVNFDSLFLGNSFNIMFLDPIIRAFLEDQYENHFEYSFFELLTKEFNEKKKKHLVKEISRFLLSLASSDGKITEDEIKCIKLLLFSFNMQSEYKDLSESISNEYLPGSIPVEMSKVEMRHFVIWILFFFANADKKLCHKEMEYIEKCAESLKVNRSNFIFIKNKFKQKEL